ncbi:MAG: hypothetical protein P8Y14_17015 [Anaerolineales bacterium]
MVGLLSHAFEDLVEGEAAAAEFFRKLIDHGFFGFEFATEGAISFTNLQFFFFGPGLALVFQIGPDRLFDLIEQTAGDYFFDLFAPSLLL